MRYLATKNVLQRFASRTSFHEAAKRSGVKLAASIGGLLTSSDTLLHPLDLLLCRVRANRPHKPSVCTKA